MHTDEALTEANEFAARLRNLANLYPFIRTTDHKMLSPRQHCASQTEIATG